MMKHDPFAELRGTIELVTFDCYGTLIDWETGIRAALREITGHDDFAFDTYLEIEAEVEARPYQSYRGVLTAVQKQLCERLGLANPGDRASLLADSIGRWPIWPDTNEGLERLKSKYRIGVLSNIDRDLFRRTAEQFSVDMDLLMTAEDVGAYKPSPRHFQAMLERVGGDRSNLLHAAQSLYHDCVPATDLGIANVWINRRGESNQTRAKPLAQFPDVRSFAAALLP